LSTKIQPLYNEINYMGKKVCGFLDQFYFGVVLTEVITCKPKH